MINKFHLQKWMPGNIKVNIVYMSYVCSFYYSTWHVSTTDLSIKSILISCHWESENITVMQCYNIGLLFCSFTLKCRLFLMRCAYKFSETQNFFRRLCTGAYENSGFAHIMRISNFYMPIAVCTIWNKNSKIFAALRAVFTLHFISNCLIVVVK